MSVLFLTLFFLFATVRFLFLADKLIPNYAFYLKALIFSINMLSKIIYKDIYAYEKNNFLLSVIFFFYGTSTRANN